MVLFALLASPHSDIQGATQIKAPLFASGRNSLKWSLIFEW
jgi:hypothetical protein